MIDTFQNQIIIHQPSFRNIFSANLERQCLLLPYRLLLQSGLVACQDVVKLRSCLFLTSIGENGISLFLISRFFLVVLELSATWRLPCTINHLRIVIPLSVHVKNFIVSWNLLLFPTVRLPNHKLRDCIRLHPFVS
jgi:hypothetical protein